MITRGEFKNHVASYLEKKFKCQICLSSLTISLLSRVAGLGRLSAGAKMAMKPFVKRVFNIFATNGSFFRVISNF